MMLFIHPYDVGDHVTLDGGMVLEVVSVSLMSTHFRELGGASCYLSNAVVARRLIQNNQRCPGTVYLWWVYRVDSNITLQQLTDYKAAIVAWSAAQPRIFGGETFVHIDEASTSESIQLSLVSAVRATWQQRQRWKGAKTRLHLFSIATFDRMGIQWGVEHKLSVTTTTPPHGFFPAEAARAAL